MQLLSELLTGVINFLKAVNHYNFQALLAL